MPFHFDIQKQNSKYIPVNYVDWAQLANALEPKSDSEIIALHTLATLPWDHPLKLKFDTYHRIVKLVTLSRIFNMTESAFQTWIKTQSQKKIDLLWREMKSLDAYERQVIHVLLNQYEKERVLEYVGISNRIEVTNQIIVSLEAKKEKLENQQKRVTEKHLDHFIERIAQFAPHVPLAQRRQVAIDTQAALDNIHQAHDVIVKDRKSQVRKALKVQRRQKNWSREDYQNAKEMAYQEIVNETNESRNQAKRDHLKNNQFVAIEITRVVEEHEAYRKELAALGQEIGEIRNEIFKKQDEVAKLEKKLAGYHFPFQKKHLQTAIKTLSAEIEKDKEKIKEDNAIYDKKEAQDMDLLAKNKDLPQFKKELAAKEAKIQQMEAIKSLFEMESRQFRKPNTTVKQDTSTNTGRRLFAQRLAATRNDVKEAKLQRTLSRQKFEKPNEHDKTNK